MAWKVFPALICGNAAVLKAAEDTPGDRLALRPDRPRGGAAGRGVQRRPRLRAGGRRPARRDPRVDVVSFTGSTAVGREIARVAGERLAKVALELGGKNPLIVCDDADLEPRSTGRCSRRSATRGSAVRRGAASCLRRRLRAFRDLLVEGSGEALTVGPGDEHDYGPVINERQLANMLAAVERPGSGAPRCSAEGTGSPGRSTPRASTWPRRFSRMSRPHSEISTTELFGPITSLYRVPDFETALAVANASPYGLTACIHTRSVHRAMEFTRRVEAGVAVVNGGTYGSEPHMPFGGCRHSGNGWREPGTEALDVYPDSRTSTSSRSGPAVNVSKPEAEPSAVALDPGARRVQARAGQEHACRSPDTR